jgi:hypothetical protein
MKKTLFFFIIIAATLGLNAQQPVQYSMKLDSVIGSDDFEWIRWKKLYSYNNDSIEELKYYLEDQAWQLEQKTLTFDNRVETYRWSEEAWTASAMTTYEYDSLNRLMLVMNYNGTDTAWIESSKYEYIYGDNGLLDTCLYSTIRNGSWRESERQIYTYDGQAQCVSLLAQRMGGGWGPFANTWMDSYKYEFEYQEGELVTELYYVSTGWFGGNLSLDSQLEYSFDANGNLQSKTASVYNGEEWIVRDVYENTFDLSVNAATVRGLSTIWETTLKRGMGYVLNEAIPLNNLWLSCTIASSGLDTRFTLYCSSTDASVDEIQEDGFKAYVSDGSLVVENVAPVDVMIYDLLGRVIATQTQAQRCSFNLRPGLYLVCNGAKVIKVVVQ